jgi:hypothetical protein
MSFLIVRRYKLPFSDDGGLPRGGTYRLGVNRACGHAEYYRVSNLDLRIRFILEMPSGVETLQSSARERGNPAPNALTAFVGHDAVQMTVVSQLSTFRGPFLFASSRLRDNSIFPADVGGKSTVYTDI